MPAPLPPLRLGDQSSITTIAYWSCYFLETPENSDQEIFISPIDNVTVYKCSKYSQYLSGASAGPTVCILICVLITIAGVFGLLANILNIIVLRHSMKGSFLQRLLIILAVFDILISVFAVLTVIFLQIIIDNVNRSKAILSALQAVGMLYSLGRTGSVFITILISIERYFVVAYPFQAKIWVSGRRSIVIIAGWLFGILLINIPWWLNAVVVKTDVIKFPSGQISTYPYIFVGTQFEMGVYTWLRPFHNFVDFVLPLPLLLLFNGLLFRSIYNWNKRREVLTGKLTREINSARMFAVIVIALFSCHTFGVINFIIGRTTGVMYRELLLSIIFAVTLNATVNFFVYYYFGQTFRDHFWYVFGNKILGRKEYTVPLHERARTPESSDVLQENVHFQRDKRGEQCRLLERKVREDELRDCE